ncbi:amidase [Nocardioidaceae bacterium]|nr:amidase [Nocardioidaceae bacterium]
MKDYADHDATALAEKVRAGEVTASELLDDAKSRAAQVNSRLNAIVAPVEPTFPSTEEQQAGPFAGVPFLVKDLMQDVAGYPTTGGSRSQAEVVPEESATVVRRWIDAGLVVFGKTNTPEFGAKGITESTHLGVARNPWNLDHTPGGSSGGAAAAVAAGIIPCAAASDGGGSIRIPASACGLFGLKPSRGLVPSGPTMGEAIGGTSTDGVISRSVRDTAGMLDVLMGPAEESPYVAALPPRPLTDEVGEDPGRLRIGMSAASSINDDVHPDARAAMTTCAEVLRELGHEVVELDEQPFDDAALAADFLTTWFVNAAVTVDNAKAAAEAAGKPVGDEAFEDDTLMMAALGRATSSTDYVKAIQRRHTHLRRLADFHRAYDFLLTPTTATPPPRIGALDTPFPARLVLKGLLKARVASTLRFTPIVQTIINDNLGWVPYTQLANLTGRPAMSVPLFWGEGDLPIGSQLVGSLNDEPRMIRLAAQLEETSPWRDKHPAL